MGSETVHILLTPEQLSELLVVPISTLADYRLKGKGPKYLRFGRHVRYRAVDVNAWLDGQMVEAA